MFIMNMLSIEEIFILQNKVWAKLDRLLPSLYKHALNVLKLIQPLEGVSIHFYVF